MLPKFHRSTIVSVILLIQITGNQRIITATEIASSAFKNDSAHNGESTTTSLLPLQPPINVTSTTTTNFLQNESKEKSEALESDLEESIKRLNEFFGNHQKINYNSPDNELRQERKSNGDAPSDLSNATAATPEGYLKFDLSSGEKIPEGYTAKAERVNEVLTNLFPNGFSDIFRFSYASDMTPSTTTTTESPEAAEITTTVTTPNENDAGGSSSPPEPTTMPATTTESTTTPATATTPTMPPSSTTQTTSSTTPFSAKQRTSYSYQTSVSKEYRREIKPGHLEIVVEKLATPQRWSSPRDYKVDSNLITSDELLRINRAAVDAPVLPSLLIDPIKMASKANNSSEDQTLLTMSGPIVILKDDNSAEMDESEEDDNQIAESQHIVQHVYQRLPETNGASYPYKSENGDYKEYHQRQQPEPEINVQIIDDESLKKSQGEVHAPKLFTPARPLNAPLRDDTSKEPREEFVVSRELDSLQEHAEHNFDQGNLVQEAPSRQFLKHFNPVLTENPGIPVKKGSFHYEAHGANMLIQQPSQSPSPPAYGDYSREYGKPPREQLVYVQQTQREGEHQPADVQAASPLHTHIRDSQPVASKAIEASDSVSPKNILFVTVSTPTAITRDKGGPTTQASITTPAPPSEKSPYEYVSEAAAASSQKLVQQAPPKVESNPSPGYTYVEVQKSINIHNKLITEKNGQLVETHETFYPQPQYQPRPASPPPPPFQHFSSQSQQNYASLSTNPINVQHVDYDDERQEESVASHASTSPVESQHIQLIPAQQVNYVEKIVEKPVPYPVKVEKIVPKTYPVEVEKIVDRPYPVTQVVEKKVPEPYPVKEIVEKVVDRPVTVEKIVDRPVEVPYPVQVNHFIDRPYPVHEIVEQHIPVPVAVPEPMPYPVHVEHYIDRPYPVETIVEKPMPYPVEKVVEKVVEKHVPIEVERIVEKPVETVVKKFVDRPVPIPIHIPVAVPVPIIAEHSPHHHHPGPHYLPPHPNALMWPHSGPMQISKLPPKVLQSYYTRILKKLLPQMTAFKTTPSHLLGGSTKIQHKPSKTSTTPMPSYKLSDIRFDLQPPPLPMGSSWSQGARYIYNTLPRDLDVSAASAPDSQQPATQLYRGSNAPAAPEHSDHYERWRNGPALKRSPDFGRNLHVEYGFKPPLVPSVEIDDKGMPLKSVEPIKKAGE